MRLKFLVIGPTPFTIVPILIVGYSPERLIPTWFAASMIGLPVTFALIGIIVFGKPSTLITILSLNNPQISLYKVILISVDLFAGKFPIDGSHVNAMPLLLDKYRFVFFSSYLANGSFSSLGYIILT